MKLSPTIDGLLLAFAFLIYMVACEYWVNGGVAS
jgi:hypothetical protein